MVCRQFAMNTVSIMTRLIFSALVWMIPVVFLLGSRPALSAKETEPALENLAPRVFHTLADRGGKGASFIAHDGSGVFVLQAGELRMRPSEGKESDTLRFRWVGSLSAANLVGREMVPIHLREYSVRHSEAADHQSRCFSRIGCHNLYPGIDLVYYWNQGELEFDFEIAPQADPTQIALEIEGVQSSWIDSQGDLVLQTVNGIWRQRRPIAYQPMPDGHRIVRAHYVVQPKTESIPASGGKPGRDCLVRFVLGTYDRSQRLIIDPTLRFASPLGGSLEDRAYAVAFDVRGCLYVAGQTASTNFPGLAASTPTVQGASDVFVTKYAPDRSSILFSVLLGGSGEERPHQVAVTPEGRLAIVGTTSSPNYPLKDAWQEKFGGGERDGFLTVLDGEGHLVLSTYLGGLDMDELAAVAVDAQGRIVVGGITRSADLPVQRPLQSSLRGGADGFIARFAPEGTIDFCSFLGGSGPLDGILDLAVDAVANVYLTGYTSSSDFPTVNPLQSAYLGGMETFVAKLNSNGVSLVFATFLGGTGDDVGRGIVIDQDGGVIVCGDTTSDGFPIINPLYSSRSGGRDLFLSKLDSTGSTLLRSTYLGGQGDELASISPDGSGNIWLAGVTSSRDFPLASAFQPVFGGGRWDGFLASLKCDEFALTFSTFLGGSGQDQLSAIAIDSSGCAHVVGSTGSTNIPMVQPLQARLIPNSPDAFVAWITPAPGTNIFGSPAKISPAAKGRPTVARPAAQPLAPAAATNILDQLGAALPFFGKNLVVNGDAEGGAVAASPGLMGWETDEGVRVGSYTDSDWLKTLTNGGRFFFLGFTNPSSGRAWQKINLAACASFIDSGEVKYSLSANLCGWEQQPASASVRVSFLDSKGKQLVQGRLGPIVGRERSFFNRLIPATIAGGVPAGTRELALELNLLADQPSETPACADNIQLILLRPPAPLLQVTRNRNQVKLSWPAALGPVILEASPTLPPVAQWQTVTNAPSLVNGQNTLQLGVDMANLYFRLRRSTTPAQGPPPPNPNRVPGP